MEEQMKERLTIIRKKIEKEVEQKNYKRKRRNKQKTTRNSPGHTQKIEARGSKVIRYIDDQLSSASLILHYMCLISDTLY